MSEKLLESISALIDDEISEIEVHRLLRQFSDDDELRRTWVNYQQIRAVSQGNALLSSQQHLDLHSSISQAVDAESVFDGSAVVSPQTEVKQGLKTDRWYKPVTGLAVAASLVMAVYIGLQPSLTVDSEPAIAGLTVEAKTAEVKAFEPIQPTLVANSVANSAATSNTPVTTSNTPVKTSNTHVKTSTTPLPTSRVNDEESGAALAGTDSTDVLPEMLRELSPEDQDKLRQYLFRHEQMNRRNRNVRTVNFDPRTRPEGSN